MGSGFLIKTTSIAVLTLLSLSVFAADLVQHKKSNIKNINSRSIISNQATESWEIHPPYDGYGFGLWGDDHRIQKVIVHVNSRLSDSNEMPASVKFQCNGTTFKIDAGETVICERSLDNYAGVTLDLNEKRSYPYSEGTVKFIMEDIN